MATIKGLSAKRSSNDGVTRGATVVMSLTVFIFVFVAKPVVGIKSTLCDIVSRILCRIS